ncbi:MAG: ferritin [Bacteroidales bacterium]|nr:ferritin [Bacteroidales bacterium]MDD5975116.1 ferritin [Bacteroidales bacterium]MDY5194016.1 ferritin [Candidatus Aphodosoma sp.]
MMNAKVEEAINAQINAEFWSAYLYLSMSAYCHKIDKPGMANWFYVQFKEEQDHAQIFFNYIMSRGGNVVLKPIAEVETEWVSPREVFEATLTHEKKVTSLIHNLYDIATQEKDFATQSMLKWFIDEQVEEEENARNIINSLAAVEGNNFGLYMIDKELGARTYTQASPLQSSK